MVEDAFRKSYLPFLNLLEKNEFFRISLHFTGILYEWMKKNQPEGFELIGNLVDRGQIELLTGAFYEPILPIIPDKDKIGQIRQQTDFISKEFGVQPTGMWLAERVWEPQLPVALRKAGVEYTILDDIHFRFTGLEEDDLDGYYLTEDEGRKIALFPISRRLRYTIPFADPEKTVEHLGKLADDSGTSLGIYADDGEKFGVWPDTYKHCYEDKWLERFFAAIEDNLDWIEMITFGEALNQTPPKGLTYLPTASYSEMNEWALPAKAIGKYEKFVERLRKSHLYDDNVAFVKGGFWRNFLSKYPETNHLHKKMLSVSHRLQENGDKLSEAKSDQIRTHLYAGQCNCPYWHGVFGGLYLPHLRGTVMQELVSAEKLLQEETRTNAVEVTNSDFDCDGYDELLVSGKDGLAVLAPSSGGSITELDFFPVAKNLVDIVGRRLEGYHHKLLEHDSDSKSARSIHDIVRVKEEGLEQLLTQDPYRRGLFIDHLLHEGTTSSALQRNEYDERSDLPTIKYRLDAVGDSGDEATIALGSETADIKIGKRFRFGRDASRLSVEYELTSKGEGTLTGEFAVEFGLGSFPFPAGESSLFIGDGKRITLDECHDREGTQRLLLHSRLYDFGVQLTAETQFLLHSFPLYTVSLSEGGFEKVYQGVIIIPAWKVSLNPGESLKATLSLSLMQGTESELLEHLKNHASQPAL